MQYFKPQELACKCGCGKLPALSFCQTLDHIRWAWGKPIYVTSGARCKEYNEMVGGAENSSHVRGIGVDLVRDERLLEYLFANLGPFDIYVEEPSYTPTHIHIDRIRRENRIFFP